MEDVNHSQLPVRQETLTRLQMWLSHKHNPNRKHSQFDLCHRFEKHLAAQATCHGALSVNAYTDQSYSRLRALSRIGFFPQLS